MSARHTWIDAISDNAFIPACAQIFLNLAHDGGKGVLWLYLIILGQYLP